MSSTKGSRLYLHGDIKIVFSNTYKMQLTNEEDFVTTIEGPTPKVTFAWYKNCPKVFFYKNFYTVFDFYKIEESELSTHKITGYSRQNNI